MNTSVPRFVAWFLRGIWLTAFVMVFFQHGFGFGQGNFDIYIFVFLFPSSIISAALHLAASYLFRSTDPFANNLHTIRLVSNVLTYFIWTLVPLGINEFVLRRLFNYKKPKSHNASHE